MMDHCPGQLSPERLKPETDKKQSQANTRQTLGNPVEMGREDFGSPEAKNTMGKHTESRHLGSWERTETKPPSREPV